MKNDKLFIGSELNVELDIIRINVYSLLKSVDSILRSNIRKSTVCAYLNSVQGNIKLNIAPVNASYVK